MKPWHAQGIQDVLSSFSTGKNGLSDEQVLAQREQYGRNVLPQAPSTPVWLIFIRQFTSPLMMVLLFAAGASALLGEFFDVFVISLAIGVNTILGFVEELKADRSLEAIKNYLPQQSRVRRDGHVVMIPAAEVVPGDILLLEAGDKLTADARVIMSRRLETSESALTGESASIQKTTDVMSEHAGVSDRLNMVFAGTVVVAGRGEAIVTATGVKTEIGTISQLVSDVHEENTPLQSELVRLSKWLGTGMLSLSLLVALIGFVRGHELIEVFKIAVALAVAAIPEGLLVTVTVILAIGMQRILKRQALVRRLVAAETLGGVSVICTDKTGTMTTGEMALTEVVVGEDSLSLDADDERVQRLLNALYVQNASTVEIREGKLHVNGSPTEAALMRGVYERVDRSGLDAWQLDDELAFDSARKFAARIHKHDGNRWMTVLGAPDVLMERVIMSSGKRQEIEGVYKQLVKRGLRVLLVAQKREGADIEHIADLELLGFVGLIDPLREETAQAIEQAKRAGLLPIMITGDHPDTAYEIATQAGFEIDTNQVVTGAQMDDWSDEELEHRVKDIRVYARVMPQHKLRIVNAWKAHGQSVAMTGDGVNDAPAIKTADIGIALGSGTEVAKQTADMVLLDDNYLTIIQAVREGRMIFDNIRKVAAYLLTYSFSEIILVIGALIFGLPIPLLPAQILWINLVTDGLPGIALSFEQAENGVMRRGPRKKDEPILNRDMKKMIFIVGAITSLSLFALYAILITTDMELDRARSIIFVALGIDSLLYVFSIRKLYTGMFKGSILQNRFLIVGVIGGLVLQILPFVIPSLRDLFSFVMLYWYEWLWIIGLSMIKLIGIDMAKVYFIHRPGARMS